MPSITSQGHLVEQGSKEAKRNVKVLSLFLIFAGNTAKGIFLSL